MKYARHQVHSAALGRHDNARIHDTPIENGLGQGGWDTCRETGIPCVLGHQGT